MINKIAAIVRKDFLMESSYKTAFVSGFLGIVVNLLVFFFIDKLFGHRIAPHLEPFGIGFFPYVMLNMGFFHYIGIGAGSFAARIRQEQLQGTLESLFLTPTETPTLLTGMGIWSFVYASLNVLIYAAMGYFLFNIDFSGVNIASFIIVLILTIVSFSSLGIISASFILIIKKGNPVEWLLNSVEAILGGVYFPVTILHTSLQALAQCLPITHAIRALQLAVYQGYSIYDLKTEITVLALFSAVLLPLSGWIFERSLERVRRMGGLGQY